MQGYRITFEGLPRPVWGCETTISNYSWENHHPDDLFEISIANAEYLVRKVNNIKRVFENVRTLSCIVKNEGATAYSLPDNRVSVISIAVSFEKINVISKELTADDCLDGDGLLLPMFSETISDDELDELNILMHKYIQHNEKNTEYDKIMCYSIFYDILAKIDAYVREELNPNTKTTSNRYIKKVNWIIQKQYNSKLTEAAIASELGISSGYLSAMYKKSTGRTISEYLLMFRMRKAEELLENINMPTAKIATAVGFDDENYFRKRFKQYFGITIKEYKNIKHGNTLYHEKPVKESSN